MSDNHELPSDDGMWLDGDQNQLDAKRIIFYSVGWPGTTHDSVAFTHCKLEMHHHRYFNRKCC